VATMSKVSIIIPFYNCPYIDQAIQSALNQTYSNIEVIVVNDGSTKFTEKVTPFLSKIRYLEKENGGTGSALNLGIKNATGDYFAWLSSDDLFIKDKVRKQLYFMKVRNAYFSYTNYSTIDTFGRVIAQAAGINFPNKLGVLQHFRIGNHINGCTVMMKKEVFSALGLFNEELKFTQDYDFWLRAVQNFELYYLNEPLVKYRVHNDMGTKKFSEIITKEIEIIKQKYADSLVAIINKEQNTRK
jgi:glycosyltransferase involved in cell wall biosynthesis